MFSTWSCEVSTKQSQCSQSTVAGLYLPWKEEARWNGASLVAGKGSSSNVLLFLHPSVSLLFFFLSGHNSLARRHSREDPLTRAFYSLSAGHRDTRTDVLGGRWHRRSWCLARDASQEEGEGKATFGGEHDVALGGRPRPSLTPRPVSSEEAPGLLLSDHMPKSASFC